MVCGSLGTRELVLTSRMYPYHVRESLYFNNVDNVGDIYLRNIWQHTRSDEKLTITQPQVTNLSLRNIYQFWKQFAEKIRINKPKVLALSIKNLINRYTSPAERLFIRTPLIRSIYLRSYLQKLKTFPLDEKLTVMHPIILEMHHKNVVSKYDEKEIGILRVNNAAFLAASLRNVLQKQDAHEALSISNISDIQVGGTTKPYLKPPVLTGDVELGRLFSVPLEWADESITHTGYYLYRDTSPIPTNTTLDPIKELSRDSIAYEDWDVQEDTTYFYRVTPKSIYGRFFSNLLELYVPIYLRAPHSFLSDYLSRTQPVEVTPYVQTFSKGLALELHFTSLSELRRLRGFHRNKIYHTDLSAKFISASKSQAVAGTSKIGFNLRKESSLFSSLRKQSISYINYATDFFTRKEGYSLSLVKEAVVTSTIFDGFTKAAARASFVILGALIENTYFNRSGLSKVHNVYGNGSRVMELHRPNALILKNGVIYALVGVYGNAIYSSTPTYSLSAVNQTTNGDSSYAPSTGTNKEDIKLTLLDKLVALAGYVDQHQTLNYTYAFRDFKTTTQDVFFDGTTPTHTSDFYCSMGYRTDNEYCKLAKDAVLDNTSSTSYSLGAVYNVRAFSTEDPTSVIYSGYLPPSGMPLTYDTYRLGNHIIPVFKRNYVVPHNGIQFTLYEKIFKSKEIVSGYTSPNGVGIRFSLFVDED